MFPYRQAGCFCRRGAAFFLVLLCGIRCAPKTDLEPPVEAPLSRAVIGYGVVSAPYTRVMNEPDQDGVALGIVREKTVVTVLERRVIKQNETPEYWVLIDGTYRGWLPEPVIILYDTEGKAKTAASQER